MPHSRSLSASFLRVKDTGHEYARTSHIPFIFAQQAASTAAYGYDFFISVPPDYMTQPEKQWPLIVFLHGAGESQQEPDESYACLRHGIPKIILCYDALMSGAVPQISIPKARRLRDQDIGKPDRSATPVPPDVCRAVAEEFVTLTPVLNLSKQRAVRPRTTR
ncbi:putative phospholipase carboxylesterase protein [Neofusicoccum parvum UCRNP2]|uniref:Putative phospholipase carboxylesterase protein n=1 Tax=Botryosphaeria parva (strain UCR-NP2) TaxID=1287680 RepID=R1GRR1_BOTPV|nr:putative phospholipase carboxylesterase protein [Neofusicoccum parvum UCRNP2]